MTNYLLICETGCPYSKYRKLISNFNFRPNWTMDWFPGMVCRKDLSGTTLFFITATGYVLIILKSFANPLIFAFRQGNIKVRNLNSYLRPLINNKKLDLHLSRKLWPCWRIAYSVDRFPNLPALRITTKEITTPEILRSSRPTEGICRSSRQTDFRRPTIGKARDLRLLGKFDP